MSSRRSGFYYSRETLMERARASRAQHIQTAVRMTRAIETEQADPALPALATWGEVLTELRAAKVYAITFVELRRRPRYASLTWAEYEHIRSMARIRGSRVSHPTAEIRAAMVERWRQFRASYRSGAAA